MREPTRKIVWIASYPKSGNTWLRFLTCNLLFGPIESAEKLDWLAPDLHELRGTVQLPAQRVMFKTHFPYSPALPLGKFTFAALYIVRDPADVLLSNYHYSKRTGAPGTIDPADFDRYVDDFIATQGDPRWLAMNMGTWEGNVRSWIEATDEFPVLQLRYEDLLADGAAAAAGICRFLGISRTPGQIEAALAGASFERLRAIEESDIRARRHGIFYKPYLQDSITAGLRFMRAGVGGEARRTLSDDQRRRFDAVFGAMRRRLNYC